MKLRKLITDNPELKNIIASMPYRVKDRLIIKEIPSNTIIQRKNDRMDYFFILCKGNVRVINEFENGRSYLIETNESIDFIGEVAALANQTEASVTTETLTDTTVIQIRSSDFKKWIESSNEFLLLISNKVANKLYSSSYSKGVELLYPAIHIMVNLIVSYAGKEIKAKEKVYIDLTREKISEELGVTTRTVNRTIKRLKEENMISINKGKIKIDKSQYSKLYSALRDKRYL